MKTVALVNKWKFQYRIQESDSGNFETTCMSDEKVSLTYKSRAFKTLEKATEYGENYFKEFAS